MNTLIHRGKFLNDFFRGVAPDLGNAALPNAASGLRAQIKADIKEDAQAYTVHAEIPGVAQEDIHLSVDGHAVTLRAEVKRQDAHKGADGTLLRSESYSGVVSRSFHLMVEIDPSAATAQFDNGVLTLTLPKKQGAASPQPVLK